MNPVLAAPLVFGAVLLILAAMEDLVDRKARNGYWLLMLVPAVVTVALEPLAFVSGLLGVLTGTVMWASRMGGADVKAVAVSAFLFPEPLLWVGAISSVVIGAGVWWLSTRSPVPFLVPLAGGLGTVLLLVAATIAPVFGPLWWYV